MARFNIFENGGGSGYLLDVQSVILSGLYTRVVVPLLLRSCAPYPAQRVRRLEEAGVIRGYRADLDPNQLNAGHVLVVQVTMEKTSEDALQRFNEAVRKIPEVQSCYMVAGNFDYLLKVRTHDISHYRAVLGAQIGKLPHVH